MYGSLRLRIQQGAIILFQVALGQLQTRKLGKVVVRSSRVKQLSSGWVWPTKRVSTDERENHPVCLRKARQVYSTQSNYVK